MSKQKKLNALKKELMDTYEYMRCVNLLEFNQRLTWLSEGMLKNHITKVEDYSPNLQEIALYNEYREKRTKIKNEVEE